MNHISRDRAAKVVAATLGEGSTVRHTGGTYDAWEVTAPDGRRWKLVSDASIAGKAIGPGSTRFALVFHENSSASVVFPKRRNLCEKCMPTKESMESIQIERKSPFRFASFPPMVRLHYAKKYEVSSYFLSKVVS